MVSNSHILRVAAGANTQADEVQAQTAEPEYQGIPGPRTPAVRPHQSPQPVFSSERGG